MSQGCPHRAGQQLGGEVGRGEGDWVTGPCGSGQALGAIYPAFELLLTPTCSLGHGGCTARVALSPLGTDTVYSTSLYMAGDPAWGTAFCLEREAGRQSSLRPILEHGSPLCCLKGLSSPSCHCQQRHGAGSQAHYENRAPGRPGPNTPGEICRTAGLMNSTPTGRKRTPKLTQQLGQNVISGASSIRQELPCS